MSSASPPSSASGGQPPTSSATAQSGAQLAQLLASALADAESANAERDSALERAKRAEHLLEVATSNPPSSANPPAGTPTSATGNPDAANNTITTLQTLIDAQQRTINDLTHRLKQVTEAWAAFELWSSTTDGRIQDARAALRRTINTLTDPSVQVADNGASSPLPRDLPPFQLPPTIPRKSSRSHPGLHIAPGAPGGRPTSQAGVPANLPPPPIAGRVRPRDDLPHRPSEDDHHDPDSYSDNGNEPRAKRFRPDPSSIHGRHSDSPRSATNQFAPHYTFPHHHPQHPPQYSRQQPHLQIERPYVHRLDDHRGHPRRESESTLASAITPTSAATTVSVRSNASNPVHGGSAGSKDSYYHQHRHSRSTGDARMDSLGVDSHIISNLHVASPPPLESSRKYAADEEDALRRREKDKERQERQMALAQRMTQSMDVDPDNAKLSPPIATSRDRHDNDDDDKNSVDELLLNTISPDNEHDLNSTADDMAGEERDELEGDRGISPMSVPPNVARHQRRLSAADVERWKERDRQRDMDREHTQPPHHIQEFQFAPATGSNGLVKLKERTGDRFRHYSTPQQVAAYPTSPRLPHHGSTFPPPPMTATFSMQGGTLQQTGRRGTIAGLVTTPSREEYPAPARASFSGQGHVRRPSNDASPLSAGSPSTGIMFTTPQPRHTGPGPAVRPTLNAAGQRTCRQCGQPGRYKEGKCVEKWGPGPAGPGTVCDRCRKKMKRVERRGTQEQSSLGQHIPLVALASSQASAQQTSPRQAYPGGDQQSFHREFQFQPPLSATSGSWSKRDSVPTIKTPRDRETDRGRDKDRPPPKEKRRTPSFSDESVSPPPPASRKASGDTTTDLDMEAADLLVEMTSANPSPSKNVEGSRSPAGTTLKDKEVDEDADGDEEDAVGEEDGDEEDGRISRKASVAGKPSWAVKLEEEGALTNGAVVTPTTAPTPTPA